MIDVIFADTHSAEYLLHKYWARKPHNVLNTLIKDLIPKRNSIVLDPFCGSGVFLREASKLGHVGYGYDINPIASILSDITCNPPDANKFRKIIEPILKKFEIECSKLYQTKNNFFVKYYIHEVITQCRSCKLNQTKAESIKKNNISLCKKCNNKLSFSLKNLIDTKISAIFVNKKIINKKEELIKGKELENLYKKKISPEFDLKFEENNRILAFYGMSTKNLFTSRNFYLLSFLAKKIHKINDDKMKNTALLLLSATVAQCSRLIPFRNNFTTGGPAWSVPGFWVPSIHIEGNPYTHIMARLKRFNKGIELLSSQKKSEIKILNKDCIEINKSPLKKVDLIFLDPPYGDSVPYMEFSMMWNSFLKLDINLSKDISVSDKNNKKFESWKKYKSSLIDRMNLFKQILAKKGKLLVTFNNHDHRAWEALVEALQKCDFYCNKTMYQIPAVISSKAQFSKDGSYISDIYSVFKHKKNFKFIESLNLLKKDVLKSTQLRNGLISKTCLYRTIYMSLLKNNISFKMINNLDKFIKENFDIIKNNYYLKNYKKLKISKLRKIVCVISKNNKSSERILWRKFYLEVINIINDISLVEPSEIMEIISKDYEIKNGFISKKKKYLNQKNFNF